jgi:hypothetical protein
MLPLALLATLTGCTHMQLKRNTIRVAGTLEDVYQQQVLDNLAKFVYDPNSLPHFALPNAGSSQVTDTGTGDVTLSWLPSGFEKAILDLKGERAIQESWTLDPVRDPRKLTLMRCAYQKAIANCGLVNGPSAHCPDCQDRFDKFYHNHSAPNEREHCLEAGRCWFRWGCKKDVPKHCRCLPVGRYCGVYVWVPPEGREELTRLTLAILDYAVFEPTPDVTPTKDVVIFLGKNNELVKEADAVKKISATVAQDQDLSDVTPILRGHNLKPIKLPPRKTFHPESYGILQLRQQLNALAPNR